MHKTETMESGIVIISSQKYEGAHNLALLGVEYLESEILLNEFDALIFTSKNSILAIERLKVEWKQKDLFVISQESANLATMLGGKVVYISKGAGAQDFAKELPPLLKDKKTVFARGEDVAFDLCGYLRGRGIDVVEAILYRTSCIKTETSKLPADAKYVIFGSPKCVECFLKCCKWSEDLVAVALGETTAGAFPKEFEYIISPYKSIQKTVLFLKER